MKLVKIIILNITISLLFFSCDSSLLKQDTISDSDNANTNGETHLITGTISAQNYSTDSDNDWLTISDPNILKDESMVQIQFKALGEDMYAVYTEWPIPPNNFHTEIRTIYKSSMTITADEKQQYIYIEMPEITQSIIDSGSVMVYFEGDTGEWWQLPFSVPVDDDSDSVSNVDYLYMYESMYSLESLYFHKSSSTAMNWSTTGSFKIKVVIIPVYYEDYWAYYAMYIDDGSIYMLDESNGHKIGWDYKLIVINP